MIQVLTVVASAAASESEGIAALGIDPVTILVQGITFLVFFFIIKKFALAKIVGTLEQRRTVIEGSLDKAEELQKQNEQAEKRVNALLHEARGEAQDIIEKSKQEALSIVSTAELSAGKKAEKIVEDGRKQIQSDVSKAHDELKKQTLQLVAAATEAVLQEKIDESKDHALIKKAITEARL